MNKELQRLTGVAQQHSYQQGFNGRLTKYRAWKLGECLPERRESALELGCGEGMLTAHAARVFKRVTAVDAAADYLRAAKQTAPHNVSFVESLIEEFETHDKFDMVILSGVLEHVENPKLILRRCTGWLTPEAAIFCLVPNALALHRRLGKAMGLIADCHDLSAQDFAVGHRRYYDRQSLESAITDAGLRVLKSEGILLKPLSNQQMQDWPETLCDGLYEVGRELPDYCAELCVLCKP
jgi:2-polyprenyl-3-methyl-5-hydroxy-6-metoxy-1,4-benzoquinol methylase